MINGLLNKKTIQQCFYLFLGSLIGGILGAIAGSIIGLFLGSIVAFFTPEESSFLGTPSLNKGFSLAITFLLIWFIVTFIGSMLGGKTFWKHYKN